MDDPARDGEWRASAEALAAELRELLAAFNTNGPPAAALAEALELARSLRARLEGPPRPRWYQSDDVKRPAYADMSPVRGRLNPVAPPLRIEVLERDPARLRVEGRARLSLAYEAPPRGAHGGWVAALFDDLLSSVQGLSPVPGYTRSLEVRFRAVTPLERELRLEAWLESESGRELRIKGECYAGEKLTAEAEAVFVKAALGEERQVE
ncbi:MAG: hypothetical protein J4G09_08725 [Proteobacteria bacterium]|nr:hypothetical protein [Pseudomonadota bacterium]